MESLWLLLRKTLIPPCMYAVLYRNPLPETLRFLQTYHRGQYKVYNLCAERCYSSTKLMAPVVHFPFEDHQTPSLSQVQEFCTDATAWLSDHPDHVIVVHCKAGKGRTGTCVDFISSLHAEHTVGIAKGSHGLQGLQL